MKQINYFLLGALVALSACTTPTAKTTAPSKEIKDVTEEEVSFSITPTRYSNLQSWGSDNYINFANAYKTSCARILKRDPQGQFNKNNLFGLNQEWQIACRKFNNQNISTPSEIKNFFETNFTPYQVSGGANGLFTGYYEASLKGSKTQSARYQYPLRARPDDLVMVDLGQFRDELKGQRIAGRVINKKLKPYESHAQIVNGGLPASQDKPVVWVDSAVDAFFLQIQGSGVVALDDGSTMRVGYAGQNGHPYYAIGRELIKMGALTKENVSMQSIREWLENNPDQAQDVMFKNKSYVFFRELDEGPIGAEGVVLTPERSIAIDKSYLPYGMPLWLVTDHAVATNKLMMTQDTGGAIRGPVRGDYFWGFGDRAENMAGEMKAKGRYWVLLPKNL